MLRADTVSAPHASPDNLWAVKYYTLKYDGSLYVQKTCYATFRIPGGSAANVLKGIANLTSGSAHCRFVGMVGRDATGTEYRDKLAAQGVEPVLLVGGGGGGLREERG